MDNDEIQGRKENSACLISIFYQPSSENNKKTKQNKKGMDRKTLVRTLNSKTDMERKNYNWRQQH